MYYRVLMDAGGYHAGDILDLGDVEQATQIGRVVPLLKLTARPEPESVAPVLPITPEPEPVTPEPEPIAPEPVMPVLRIPSEPEPEPVAPVKLKPTSTWRKRG